MTDLVNQLSDTINRFRADLDEAARTQHDHLSESGNKENQERLCVAANERATKAMTAIHAKAVSEEATAKSLARTWLTTNESTRDEWDRVKMILDAGKPLAEILAGSSAHRVNAIREWGGAYLEAQFANISMPATAIEEALDGSTIARLAELDTSGQVAKYRDARNTLAAADDLKQRMDEVLIGGATIQHTRSMAIAYASTPVAPLALKDLPDLVGKS